MMKPYSPPPLPVIADDRIPFFTFTSEQQLCDGILKTSFVKTEVDTSKVHEGLTPDDFKLDVLLANNAVRLLKESRPVSPSSIDLANQMSNLENSIVNE